MKILTKSEQALILQRGTKAEFLVGTGFVMFGCLLIVGGLLWEFSTSVGIGWWICLFLPTTVWLLWLALRRFLSNKRIVTVYTLNKGSNQATIEFKGLGQSEFFELPLHEIRTVEVRFLDSHYIGYGYTHVRFQLCFLTRSGREIALDQAIGMLERRELEAIARHFRKFLFNR
ncbi:hypothetical protein IQ254_30800 [Nodosilinea sp. LEGE 07088]|uniref:hypothetical protein n=1 Tax=Nodosilinea sp. LEGE 07088 TaxID=2777968 RepID=UPI001882E30F|nr:hypothetical protein [Nodosilinea sp. LEGE 07088]MBE9141528.1 hypothetical protein [Nodosilinea sp. LEGE 07088]